MMRKRILFTAMSVALLVGAAATQLIFQPTLEASPARLGPPIIGVPSHGQRFLLVMDDSDTIGSVYKCMDRVHQLGGGTCEIMKGSIKIGRTMRLSRRYQDVSVSVQP